MNENFGTCLIWMISNLLSLSFLPWLFQLFQLELNHKTQFHLAVQTVFSLLFSSLSIFFFATSQLSSSTLLLSHSLSLSLLSWPNLHVNPTLSTGPIKCTACQSVKPQAINSLTEHLSSLTICYTAQTLTKVQLQLSYIQHYRQIIRAHLTLCFESVL